MAKLQFGELYWLRSQGREKVGSTPKTQKLSSTFYNVFVSDKSGF